MKIYISNYHNNIRAHGGGLIFNVAGSDDTFVFEHNGAGKLTLSPTTATFAGNLTASGDVMIGSVTEGNSWHRYRFQTGGAVAQDGYCGIFPYVSSAGDCIIYAYDYTPNASGNIPLYISATTTTFSGAVSKASGSFKIDHPLPSKKDTHYLVHSFTESPRADLIYRDKVTLVDGSATVNIDTVAGMTEGTFVLLCDNVQCFTSNESDWSAVKGSVSGNILTIECEDSSSTANIAWMVVGDRKDEHIMNTEWTDENGKPIIEPEKEALENA